MAQTNLISNLRCLLRLTGFVALLVNGIVHAACTAGIATENLVESTPNGDFHVFDDGTVAHLKTGLIWKRCAEGQRWNGARCDGTPQLVSWGGALQLSVQASDAGAVDWRVPNRKELESLVEFCGHSPAINLVQFPDTPAERFWTSTTFVDTPSRAWDVYFSDGYSGASGKSADLLHVRLVRTAPAGSLLSPQSISFAAAPVLSVGSSVNLEVVASSGLPVVLASPTPNICAVSGSLVSGLAGGVCTVSASQNGDATYYPATTVTLDLMVNKLYQTIEFGSVSNLAVSATVAVTATASSGLPVALSSASPTVCSLAGNTVTGVSPGSCTLLAEQSGNDMFNAAPTASVSFDISAPTSNGGNAGAQPDVKGFTMRLGAGWHLLGNSLNAPIIVAETFADSQIVESVWKWVPEAQRWAFFTPQFKQQALGAYARARDLEVLIAINPGEGYWLKLKQEHDFGDQRGEPANVSLGELGEGWHLVTVGQAMTPSELNAGLAKAAPPELAPPQVAAPPQSFVSLWSFNSAKGRWMFYSPALAAQGAEALKAYLDGKGYLDFDAEQQTLGGGRGFWIKK